MENEQKGQSKATEENTPIKSEENKTEETTLPLTSNEEVDEHAKVTEGAENAAPAAVDRISEEKTTSENIETSTSNSESPKQPDSPDISNTEKIGEKSMTNEVLSDERESPKDSGMDEIKDVTPAAEKEENKATSKEERHLDYSNYTKQQMVHVLESMLKEDDFGQVGRILKEIKRPYDKIANAERKAAYEKYIEEGGEKDGFEYRNDESDHKFLDLFKKLKERKNQFFNSLEKQKDHNLKIKLEILENIRQLVDSEETNASIKSLKDLQEEWKATGAIPPSQVRGLWANYNALLDRFYDQRSIYFELKELDRKKNYDLKIELCEKAEQLLKEENLREAIKSLNEYHEEFKHIGPVPKQDQEAVWGRFKAASDEIYARRKVFYEKLKGDFKVNEVAKEALVEKVSTFSDFNSDKISEWNQKTKEILAIQKEWEAIGSVSKEKAKAINKHFWLSFKSFFNNKGLFFKKLEKDRVKNLKLKQDLVKQAEELKDSEEFVKTSDALKRLQQQWKDIGPVPEKQRNEVFKQFKTACDHFFNRRRTNSGMLEKDYVENLKRKETLCGELEQMAKAEKIDLNRVKSIETEWGEIGYVPKTNIRSIQKRYTDVVEQIAEKVDLPEAEKLKLKYAAQFNKMNYGPGAERLLQKKEGSLRRQISSLENEINLWKNNIDFFASSKNADKLKAEFETKIDKANAQLKSMKEQLKVISNI